MVSLRRNYPGLDQPDTGVTADSQRMMSSNSRVEGRGRWVCSAELEQPIEFASRMREAFPVWTAEEQTADDGELAAVSSPICSLGVVSRPDPSGGFDALLRSIHPKLGGRI